MRCWLPPGSILLCSLLLFSCKEIMVWRHGIHQPRDESAGSINEFLGDYGIPSGEVYLFRDSGYYLGYLKDTVYRNNLFRAMIYSRSGYIGTFPNRNGSRQNDISGALFPENGTLHPADTARTIKRLLAGVVGLQGEPAPDTIEADFVAVITWAAFLGKYNKPLFALRSELMELDEIRVMPVFLSMDILEHWHLGKNQRWEFRDD